MTVPGRVSLITLGVADVARATAFYAALGWRVSPASTGDVTFLALSNLVLALWSATSLAEDAGRAGSPGSPGAVALAINMASEAEVDEVMRATEAAGARITKPAERTFWGGYSGYFADPDGHPWEIAHNPHWPLRPDGSVELPA